MKTDCIFFDECRRPTNVCTSRCKEYSKRKNVSKSKRLFDACWRVVKQKAVGSRSMKKVGK